jgi:hypothetical protein
VHEVADDDVSREQKQTVYNTIYNTHRPLVGPCERAGMVHAPTRAAGGWLECDTSPLAVPAWAECGLGAGVDAGGASGPCRGRLPWAFG